MPGITSAVLPTASLDNDIILRCSLVKLHLWATCMQGLLQGPQLPFRALFAQREIMPSVIPR